LNADELQDMAYFKHFTQSLVPATKQKEPIDCDANEGASTNELVSLVDEADAEGELHYIDCYSEDDEDEDEEVDEEAD